jgi:hypothetical protein
MGGNLWHWLYNGIFIICNEQYAHGADWRIIHRRSTALA